VSLEDTWPWDLSQKRVPLNDVHKVLVLGKKASTVIKFSLHTIMKGVED
jgi:hypothetical protein